MNPDASAALGDLLQSASLGLSFLNDSLDVFRTKQPTICAVTQFRKAAATRQLDNAGCR
jgi:hypothetical protein